MVVFPDLISCHGEGQEGRVLKMKQKVVNILFQYDKQNSCNTVCLFHLIYLLLPLSTKTTYVR